MPGNIKEWLDHHVVPLLREPESKTPQLRIHSEIHSYPPRDGGELDEAGNPLEFDESRFDLICVYLLAEPGTWPIHVRRLLKGDFSWDYMRDFTKIVVDGESRIVFGGDGSPFIHDNGMVSCRLFSKLAEQDVGLILEIGCGHSNKLLAQADVKELYRAFKEEDGLDFSQVQTKHAPPFGGQ